MDRGTSHPVGSEERCDLRVLLAAKIELDELPAEIFVERILRVSSLQPLQGPSVITERQIATGALVLGDTSLNGVNDFVVGRVPGRVICPGGNHAEIQNSVHFLLVLGISDCRHQSIVTGLQVSGQDPLAVDYRTAGIKLSQRYFIVDRLGIVRAHSAIRVVGFQLLAAAITGERGRIPELIEKVEAFSLNELQLLAG